MKLVVYCLFFLIFSFSEIYAEESFSLEKNESSIENHTMGFKDFIAWPFIHIIQPIFSIAVYPIAKPIHYAFDNGVIEKSVDLITFGENRNILIYPVMNLKPGSSTMLGMDYRHRSILLSKDYFVLESQYFANGDWYFSFRYSKQGIGGFPLYTAIRYQQYWDRDGFFVIPNTKDKFTQPDSSINITWRLSGPLTKSRRWNLEGCFGIFYNDASLPDIISDSILISENFSIESRGLYQTEFQFPIELSLLFDNLDYSFAPTRGRRLELSGSYVFVKPYSGVDYNTYDRNGLNERLFFQDDAKNHDFIRTELVFQQYIYLGKSGKYHMTPSEARESRRFYADFNWDDALRIWHPDNVKNALFERRVLAFQFRLIDVFEMEKGEAPFNAFPYVNNRFPLRGYGNIFAGYHVMGLSMEYRWPIDRFVDGVLFDEYALHSSEIDDWSFNRFYNSWGFGVRVRKPDMFWFRVQFGFHGLHGVNLIITVAPEYR